MTRMAISSFKKSLRESTPLSTNILIILLLFYNNKIGSENGGNRGSLIDPTASDSAKN